MQGDFVYDATFGNEPELDTGGGGGRRSFRGGSSTIDGSSSCTGTQISFSTIGGGKEALAFTGRGGRDGGRGKAWFSTKVLTVG